MMKSVLRRVALNAMLVSVVFVAGLGFMELVIRSMMPRFDVSGHVRFVEKPGLPPLGEPGSVQRQIKNTGDFDVSVAFNRHGFRDDKDTASATSADWVVVGDSFAFGYGVEQSERFSDRLQALQGRPVYNIAIPTDLSGYERLVGHARSIGMPVGRLIVSVCMENDIIDYEAPAAPIVANRSSAFSLGLVKQWLMDHSSLYFMVSTIAHGTPWLREHLVRAKLIVPNLDALAGYEAEGKALESSAAKVEALAAGRRAVVLIVPSRRLWVGDRQAEEDLRHRQFAALLMAKGLHVIDPRAELEKGGAPLSYHFANDGHWTAAGHDVAAKLLAKALVSQP